MKCPFCLNIDTQVKDSRISDDGDVKRRRYCLKCNSRFTTYERIQFKDIVVNKNNGEKELFDENKLKRSILTAVRKRKITNLQVDKIVNDIIRHLEIESDGRISSKKLGNLVMNSLKEIDKVAFIRFASVYKNFDKIEDFDKFVKSIAYNEK